MGYAEESLTKGEHILYKAGIHWIVYVPGLVLLPVLVGIFLLGRALIYAKTTEVVVTNERLIMKTGWIARNTAELSHKRIESISFQQSVWGRMLGYGTVTVMGTGVGALTVRDIANPMEFRKKALDAADTHD